MNNYPPNWPYIAFIVKKAASFSCENCGHPNDFSTSHVLTVHHIDGNKANCNFKNLVALCQRCHLHFEGTNPFKQLFLWDPPLWIRKRSPFIKGGDDKNDSP